MEKIRAIHLEKNNAYQKQFESTGLAVRIVFGMPSKDCAYNGICRIEPGEQNIVKKNSSDSFAKILWDQNRQLHIAFSKESMQEKTIRKYFADANFSVIESYNIPEFACRFLKTDKLVIQPGSYPIQENEDTIYTSILVLDQKDQSPKH